MMKVTVALKKPYGKFKTISIIAKNEFDFSAKVKVAMKEHGAYGFSRENTVELHIVK